MTSSPFPRKIGYDLSGTILALGPAVKNLKIGDEVFAIVPERCRGSIAEYCLSTSSTTALKPKSLSFTEAASLPCAGNAVVQAFERAEREMGESLKGKTVFVPAGLSGTGSLGVQVAKRVFGAGKVVTTLSPGKIGQIGKLVGEEVVDGMVDYTKGDVVGGVGRGEVDFMFDTVGCAVSALGVMRKGGVIVSIGGLPSGKDMKADRPEIVTWLVWMLNLVDWFYKTWIGRKGVRYSYLVGKGNADVLERMAKWVEDGKLRPVVGRTAKLGDIEEVRKGCQQIYDGKGGLGKFVIEVD